MKSGNEVSQSCLTLHDPMDCSLPGSSVHGIFQERVLELVAIAFSMLSPLYFNSLFIFIFYFWLYWVFIVLHGLSLVVVSGELLSSCGMQAFHCIAPLVESTGSRWGDSVVVVLGLSCSVAWGIFLGQQLNLHALYWHKVLDKFRFLSTVPPEKSNHMFWGHRIRLWWKQSMNS